MRGIYIYGVQQPAHVHRTYVFFWVLHSSILNAQYQNGLLYFSSSFVISLPGPLIVPSVLILEVQSSNQSHLGNFYRDRAEMNPGLSWKSY